MLCVDIYAIYAKRSLQEYILSIFLSHIWTISHSNKIHYSKTITCKHVIRWVNEGNVFLNAVIGERVCQFHIVTAVVSIRELQRLNIREHMRWGKSVHIGIVLCIYV